MLIAADSDGRLFILDMERLHTIRKRMEEKCKRLKRVLSREQDKWVWKHQREMLTLKQELTYLYAIIAHGRGKLHMSPGVKNAMHLRKTPRAHKPRKPFEQTQYVHQAAFIGDKWKDFAFKTDGREKL